MRSPRFQSTQVIAFLLMMPLVAPLVFYIFLEFGLGLVGGYTFQGMRQGSVVVAKDSGGMRLHATSCGHEIQSIDIDTRTDTHWHWHWPQLRTLH